jgi:hypothetical protein
MLVSEPLQSLKASPRQADCSAADGLKPANAALGNINRAKPTAAIIPFRIDMTFLLKGLLILELCHPARENGVTVITKSRLKGATTLGVNGFRRCGGCCR